MTYSVHQHWDPLKVCIVGKSYSPNFYSFVKNPKVRAVLERIAIETEEDYQKLIALLESFGVEILRPNVSDDYTQYLNSVTGKIEPPPMTPRDYSAMVGDNFYFDYGMAFNEQWDIIKGSDWPSQCPAKWSDIPKVVQQELVEKFSADPLRFDQDRIHYKDILEYITAHNNVILDKNVNSAMISRIGKDLYVGTDQYNQDTTPIKNAYEKLFPDYRIHVVDTGGHSDGTFCPVVPGLIVSLRDIPTYKDTFPGWEVIYLPNQSYQKITPFLQLKEKNRGKWWVPGEELNDDFTEFVENWLGHWVGYVEETVFDVNMLVIDEKNVVCNNYNEDVFKAFDRYGITPHVINFRHRFFWDGGLHCITSDLHREGTRKDYFPERG